MFVKRSIGPVLSKSSWLSRRMTPIERLGAVCVAAIVAVPESGVNEGMKEGIGVKYNFGYPRETEQQTPRRSGALFKTIPATAAPGEGEYNKNKVLHHTHLPIRLFGHSAGT